MIYKFTSIKEVITKIYRDLDLQEELEWHRVIEWCFEALSHIGAYSQYERKTANIVIENHRGKLPCDFYLPEQMSVNGYPIKNSADTYDFNYGVTDGTDGILNGSLYHSYTYDDCWVKTSFEEGALQLSYLAFKVDDDGFPMVPDEVSHKEALFAYCIMKMKYKDYLSGTINPNIYQDIRREWNWYCQQARNKSNMPNLDQMESIKNSWLRMIPNTVSYLDFFRESNNRERLRNFNS